MLGDLASKQQHAHKHWAWLIWGIAALSIPFQFILQSSTSVMIPMLMKQFNTNETGIGFLTSSYFYAYLLLQIPGGMLVDRFGARIVLFFSMLLASIACFLFATAHTFATAEISRLMMGAVTAPCVAGGLYIAANWFPLNRFATLVGLTEMLAALGAAFGQTALAVGVTHIGWRQTLIVCAIVGALLTGLILLIVRNRPNRIQSQSLHVEPTPEGHSTGIIRNFITIIQKPQIWLLGLFSGLSFSFISAFAGLWAVPTLQGIYSVNLEVAAIGSSMVFLGTAIGAPVLGWLADRIGRRRLIMFVVTSINMVLMLTFVLVPHLSLWLVFILLIIMGFLASVYVLAFAMVREITNTNIRGSAMGFTNMMCILIGAPLLQPLIGFILRSHEHGAVVNTAQLPPVAYQHALMTLIVSLVIALLVILFIRENNHMT